MKPKFYVPACLRKFQGFYVYDIKDYRDLKLSRVYLQQKKGNKRICHKCSSDLGSYHDTHR